MIFILIDLRIVKIMTDKIKLERIRNETAKRCQYLRSSCKHSEANEMDYILSFINTVIDEE
jgi:hypothetical protein